MNLLGMNVVSTPLAEKVERVARITRNPKAKRRRSWQLRYEEKRTPCSYISGNTMYVHPSIWERLKSVARVAAAPEIW
jgi:hypothetical protein